MKIDRLFQVLVVTGVSSVGVGAAGCSSDNNPTPSGTGGMTSDGAAGAGGSAAGASGAGGSAAGASGAGGSASCDCKPDSTNATWTDCNGCCCWLPPGTTAHAGPTPICGVDPCCTGHGR